jgi:serine/threonine protein kinase
MHSGVEGTKCWYAPEWLKLLYWPPTTRGQPRGTVKSDVFALGLVFAYLLLNGQHIYGSNEIEIINNILGDKAINIKSKLSYIYVKKNTERNLNVKLFFRNRTIALRI